MKIPFSALYLSIAPRNLSISGAETLPSHRLVCKATRVVRKSSEVIQPKPSKPPSPTQRTPILSSRSTPIWISKPRLNISNFCGGILAKAANSSAFQGSSSISVSSSTSVSSAEFSDSTARTSRIGSKSSNLVVRPFSGSSRFRLSSVMMKPVVIKCLTAKLKR